MIEELKPYTDTAATGLAWLPAAPAHWETRRIKTLLQEVDRRTATGEEKLLSLRMVAGLVGHNEVGGKPIPSSTLVGFKNVEVGEIVMNRMRAAIGLFGVAAEPGLVSPDYAIFHAAAGVDQQYLLRLFKNPTLGAIFRAESKGLGTGQSGFLRLYTDRFGAIRIPFPPLDEQRLIVRFLDWHGAMTAKLIRAKQRLIALLNEQKQSIIHRAVTRGLNPAVKLKPSGVEWLGNIPEHWDVAHLRYLSECLDGKRVPLNATQRGAKQGQYPYWGANKIIDYLNEWLFDEPLVLLGEDGAPFFLPGRDVAFAVTGKIWVNNHAHVLRCGTRLTPPFLAASLNCVDYVHFIDGSTRDKLTQGAMGSIHLQIPPIEEQVAISDYIVVATAQIGAVVKKAEAEIALIQEFRTRLIADVVTGHLDVRHVAATLPDAVEANTTDDLTGEDDLDDADALFEEDEAA